MSALRSPSLTCLIVRPCWPGAVLACLISLVAVLSAMPVMAQEGLLWEAAQPSSLWPAAPANSRDLQSIRVDEDLLSRLQEGSVVSVPFGAGTLPLMISAVQPQVNGDTSYTAFAPAYPDAGPLIMTVGSRGVFAYLETGDSPWQLVATRHEGAGDFLGWLYQAESGDLSPVNKDYRIPERDKAVTMPDLAPQSLPLRLGNNGAALVEQARTSGITGANLRIRQSANAAGVVAGALVQVSVEILNIAQERHEGLMLSLYFVLENTQLVQAPSGCLTGMVAGQRVLQCPLGDFAPGESKVLSYRVQTSVATKPRIISTALVGESRHDLLIPVVEDVVQDSDGDGVSDFNERLLGTQPDDASSFETGNSVIDVMALYTPGATALYQGQAATRINQLIAIANQIFADSGVHVTLRPVYHAQVGYSDSPDMDSALEALTRQSDPAFAQVASLRSTYGADVVMLFRPQGQETDRCGLANLGGFQTQGDLQSSNEQAYAFSHIAIDCPVSSVVAHELGHTMGLTHSHREDGYGGTFDFATGHGVDGMFTTVMAYPGAFGGAVRLPRFSSPERRCQGLPCGVPAGQAQSADAVKALNITRHQVAQYFPTRVPYLPNRPLATLSGAATEARIALAASVNKGLSFVSAVRTNESVDVNLSLYVDPRHVGLQGDVYVLATLDGERFFQLQDSGALHSWDGSFADLKAYRPGGALAPVEYLQLINAARLSDEFANRRLQIFIAYSVPSLEEVIYTAEPLSLDITP